MTAYQIPTFRQPADRRRLVSEYGLPNTDPLPSQGLFTRGCRELFVDDFHDGAPVAYFLPLPGQTSTQRTPAGNQILAPWAPALMDTVTPLRARGPVDLPLPLFAQEEDAQYKADAAKQRSLLDRDL